MALFEFREIPQGGRHSWITWVLSAALHVVAIVLLFAVSWPAAPRATFIALVPPTAPAAPELPPFGGTRSGRGPSGGQGRPLPTAAVPTAAPAPAPLGQPDSNLAASPRAVGPFVPAGPRAGDGRVWVSPRPALPAAVADVLYGEPEHRDSVAVGRLRAMVDSLNRVLDAEQRDRRTPSWVATVEGTKFGIDSQYIHVAGIKIPTAALALLPIRLPQGNYDEGLRARHLAEMRQDLLQAARRTETLRQFRQYVRELRARKQVERDAERARGDTAKAVP